MTEPTRMPLMNVSRKRMKAKMHYLRVLAVQLEKERDRLVGQVCHQYIESPREVAEDEYNKRLEAEELNAQLHDKLKEQTAIVERLKEVISRLACRVEDVHDFCQLQLDPDLFNRLLDDIHEGYRMTDGIVDTVDWDDEATRDSWRCDTRTTWQNGCPQSVVETPEVILDSDVFVCPWWRRRELVELQHSVLPYVAARNRRTRFTGEGVICPIPSPKCVPWQGNQHVFHAPDQALRGNEP